MRISVILGAACALSMLGGCISLTPDPPEQLLTLSSASQAQAGATGEGSAAEALAVQVPSVTQRLNVNRIPVSTGDASLSYLADAFWVEKPASLFRKVLAETLRAGGKRFVVEGGGVEYAAATQLGGELVEMGYDATTSSAVIRYDAVLTLADGSLRTRRFEHVVPNVRPEPLDVGRALNVGANVVAADVAEWVD